MTVEMAIDPGSATQVAVVRVDLEFFALASAYSKSVTIDTCLNNPEFPHHVCVMFTLGRRPNGPCGECRVSGVPRGLEYHEIAGF